MKSRMALSLFAPVCALAAACGMVPPFAPARAQDAIALPNLVVTGSRIETGITGASTTVITAEEIARSPAQSVPEALAQEPGVQVQTLFGGANGARSSIDLRGFGATASANTLILINGRRVHDLDQQGIDLAAIPRDSIERIEITRGNSGAVLYGDGAVGGVVNIITKAGASLPPSLRIEGGFGSFNHAEGNASVAGSSGPFSASAFANMIASDGFRVNNEYRQRNAVGDFRYRYDGGSVYFNVSGDEQHLGLPGGRLVDPTLGVNQLVANPRGATTPFDFADKQGLNATGGVTYNVVPGAELIVDGGVRQKKQQAAFFGNFMDPASPDPLSAFEATLTTWSLTPRVKIDSSLGGLPWKAIGGLDFYRAGYDSDRGLFLGAPPIHRYDLSQDMAGVYWQNTVSLPSRADVSFGARVQRNTISAGDTVDVTAPGACPFGFCSLQGIPLHKAETNHALHLGLEQPVGDFVTLFGRYAESFRVPNVDERIGMAPFGSPTAFDLRTQKSRDAEAGARLRAGAFNAQWSVYDMRLTDEIFFSPATFTNTNLDPTRRYGSELLASYQFTETVRLKGGAAYTRAVFSEGPFAGKDVPLVSRWTGSVGVAWNIIGKQLVFDGLVRYVGARRMDNDPLNVQPLIPAFALVDVRFGGEIDRFFWSAAIQNLFDKPYFDYAIASPFPFFGTLGRYNAYPQPGRTYWLRAGVTF